MSIPLEDIRDNISRVDKQLLDLLAERHKLAYAVAEYKDEYQKPLRDLAREQQLLQELIMYADNNNYQLDGQYILSIFNQIIQDSIISQQQYLQTKRLVVSHSIRFAYLGIRGSYSYLIGTNYAKRYHTECLPIGCNTFVDIIHKVQHAEADYGVLPIENTSSGMINQVYDLLATMQLSIIEEMRYPVQHSLLVAKDVEIQDLTGIKIFYSHPQVIEQCSNFIQQFTDIEIRYCKSSAHAMREVANSTRTDVAALGSAESGVLYGLKPIQKNIANVSTNLTRFFIVTKDPIEISKLIDSKISLVFSTKNTAGSLVDALAVLKKYQLNMLKLYSRSMTQNTQQEDFYLEISANLANPQVKLALAELATQTKNLNVLGCYATEVLPEAEVNIDNQSSNENNA